MTKQHFILIAKHIAALQNIEQRQAAAAAVGVACGVINDRFNLVKWYKACGV
jgi:hypothetical protein